MNDLQTLLKAGVSQFWSELRVRTQAAHSFGELMKLSSLRKRAACHVPSTAESVSDQAIKLALVGSSTLYPLSEIVEHMVATMVGPVDVLRGEFNSFRSEMLDGSVEIDGFGPSHLVVIPDEKSCQCVSVLRDDKSVTEEAARTLVAELLNLCEAAHARYGAEIILCNYLPLAYHDLGEFGTRNSASDWNFKRRVNLLLAEASPNYVHICDLEFLAYRVGGIAARDDRSWFESKQPLSPNMLVAAAREVAHIIGSIKAAPKKVLALDLDNTLWGGVIGDDGLQGIEIGDTSPRGEAFKAFQSYILSLMDRGVLLAVCSKNDFENAIEPFRVHPEMVLKEEHFVSFKANWEPKASNLAEMAEELSLGLDSFIFVDDNPAEIEIVKQFTPQVTTILLSDDPSEYVRQLQESRLFERSVITTEDSERNDQYRQEANRRRLERTAVDMDSYLESLEMTATVRDFDPLDLPRIAQLINKSNQFNLTTRRRSEAEIESLMADPAYEGFTVRLADRFGDHGLISIVICEKRGDGVLDIDTWLMSCRVLKRQVENEVLNEIFRRARLQGCSAIRGSYLQTPKNGMVRDLLPSLGFATVTAREERSDFELLINDFELLPTYIEVKIEPVNYANEARRNISSAAVNI